MKNYDDIRKGTRLSVLFIVNIVVNITSDIYGFICSQNMPTSCIPPIHSIYSKKIPNMY